VKCLFRAEYITKDNKKKYGCIYYNEPNSLTVRDPCPYKHLENCKLFIERKEK